MDSRPVLHMRRCLLAMLPLLALIACTPGTAHKASSEFTPDQMAAFVLPYDDASPGVTNLASYNAAPAGARGYLQVDAEGHFSLAGERVRFLGVNITAGSAFPAHTQARAIAKRLAKFGINLVRFHHMDNHYGAESLIDYAAGNSKSLNAANLDKLDYFVNQLKLNGIYVDINLINSREFMPGDGLPAAITQLDTKQRHMLVALDADFHRLEKAYARQLLQHVNPYTGMSYARDPAVAMVEINNENGLFQQFYDGSMDTWPGFYRDQLNTRWNAWLAAKYPSTRALETAWGAQDEPLGSELLRNPDFDSGLAGWNKETQSGAQADFTAGEFAGRQGVAINISRAADAAWHVQLNQGGLNVKQGQVYTLGFWAKANDSRQLNANLGQAHAPWASLKGQSYSLKPNWQYFESSFIAPDNEPDARINFSGFGTHLGSVYLAGVSFKPGGSLGHLASGERLEAKNISNNQRAQGYTQGRALDWAEFLRGLEQAYWAAMYSYLKADLGVKALVTGTALMNSTPSAQGQMDFVDAHAYWQHPIFPDKHWNRFNWRINNISMVNSLDNTLAGLAKQRIAGKPFTISEYQHPSPNNYGSEGPLLVAAYGALQDWDAIMMFAYDAGPNDNWAQGYFSDFFSINAHPAKMANMLIAANLFRRGDLAAAKQLALLNFPPAKELQVLAVNGSQWNVANGSHLGVPDRLPLQQRLALDIAAVPQGLDRAPEVDASAVVTADTGELRWDLRDESAGLVSINSDNTKALVGFIEGRALQLGNVRVQVQPTRRNWATLALTAQQGSFATPEKPASILLVATGYSENSAMQWTDSEQVSVANDWGKSPSLVEVIPALIDLPFASQRTRAWVLDETGQRQSPLPVQDNQGRARLMLDGNTQSLWYEIEVAGAE